MDLRRLPCINGHHAVERFHARVVCGVEVWALTRAAAEKQSQYK
jgi:hypothetical protein